MQIYQVLFIPWTSLAGFSLQIFFFIMPFLDFTLRLPPPNLMSQNVLFGPISQASAFRSNVSSCPSWISLLGFCLQIPRFIMSFLDLTLGLLSSDPLFHHVLFGPHSWASAFKSSVSLCFS